MEPEAAPTYREVVVKDPVTQKWVFDPHWLRWLLNFRRDRESFPVGAIYLSISGTNPATALGYGTWVAFAAGRTLVGLDSSDTDFDTPEETRGAKTVASAGTNANESAHTHSVTSNVAVADHAAGADFAAGGDFSKAHAVTNNAVTSGAGTAHTHIFTGTATSVIQPSIVVYMWKRTA